MFLSRLHCTGDRLQGTERFQYLSVRKNMHFEASGAYTGEVSAEMLRHLFVNYVILGHSERREYFGETDAVVNQKTRAALAASLKPIVCVGESLEQREADETIAVIKTQVEAALAGVTAEESEALVIAYEPIWAIGTGKTATPKWPRPCIWRSATA